MELNYRNTREDHKAFAKWSWRDSKNSQKHGYYRSLLWYSSIFALSFYLCFLAQNVFIACILAALCVPYWWHNKSFEKKWLESIEYAITKRQDFSATTLVDDKGITESYLGLSVHVPWNQIHEYAIFDGRLFITYLTGSSFIIPLQDIGDLKKDELVRTLTDRGVRQAAQP